MCIAVTDSTFEAEVLQRPGLVVVDFWAPWCGPCRALAPVLDDLARVYAGRAIIAKLNVDEAQQTAARFNIRSVPTLLFFRNGTLVETVVGAVPRAQIERTLTQHLA